MKNKTFLFLISLFSIFPSCSYCIDKPNIKLICKAENPIQCPSREEINAHISLYEQCFDYRFDFENEPLTIIWWGEDKRWPYQGKSLTGFTDWDGLRVNTTGFRNLTHELNHIRLARLYEDPDINHSKSPGPWTEDDDWIIRNINDTGTCDEKSADW